MKHTTNDTPYGYCHCGCGEHTNLAPRTDKTKAWIKGEPLHYCYGHKGKENMPQENPNPTGLCMCGCGQPAPIAEGNIARLGHVKGQPVRFILGHHNRLKVKRPIAERFWEKVDVRGPDECWPWKASINAHGYGQFNYEGECWHASRFAYFLVNGPIPEGYDVLHRCDNPPCCNLAHFFLGTQSDNSLDMWAKGRGSKPPIRRAKNA